MNLYCNSRDRFAYMRKFSTRENSRLLIFFSLKLSALTRIDARNTCISFVREAYTSNICPITLSRLFKSRTGCQRWWSQVIATCRTQLKRTVTCLTYGGCARSTSASQNWAVQKVTRLCLFRARFQILKTNVKKPRHMTELKHFVETLLMAWQVWRFGYKPAGLQWQRNIPYL